MLGKVCTGMRDQRAQEAWLICKGYPEINIHKYDSRLKKYFIAA